MVFGESVVNADYRSKRLVYLESCGDPGQIMRLAVHYDTTA